MGGVSSKASMIFIGLKRVRPSSMVAIRPPWRSTGEAVRPSGRAWPPRIDTAWLDAVSIRRFGKVAPGGFGVVAVRCRYWDGSDQIAGLTSLGPLESP